MRNLKILSILLAFSILLSCLTACNTKVENEEKLLQEKYDNACYALACGEYDEAYNLFEELGNYSDSRTMLKEVRYKQAENLFVNYEYEDAYKLFDELGAYEDSQTKAKEVAYSWASNLLDEEKYEEARTMFSDLGKYSNSATMVSETKYLQAIAFSDDGEYEKAYDLYREIDGYKDSKDKILFPIMMMATEVLTSDSSDNAAHFVEHITLTNNDEYSAVYVTVGLHLNAHENIEYWYNGSATTATHNTKALLDMLPTTYEDTKTLLSLMNLFTSNYNGYSKFFRENEDLMRDCWSFAFVRDMAESDEGITYFLECEEWNFFAKSMKFYKNENGGTTFETTLPAVEQPTGTKYFDIKNSVLWWTNDEADLAKVFEFEIVDYDTINVYCYEDGSTHELWRH